MTIARKYALFYLLMGSLWILLSDFLVFNGTRDENFSLLNWELFKGLLFVTLTSFLVYFLLLKSTQRINADKRKIEIREEILCRILDNSGNKFGLFNEYGRLIYSTDEGYLSDSEKLSTDFFASFKLNSKQTDSLNKLLKECNNQRQEAQRDLTIDADDTLLCFIFIPIKDHPEIMVIVEDHTAKKRQEKDLRINQKIMDLIFLSREIGIWDWDIRNNLYRNNQNMQDIVGAQTESEVPRNKEWNERIHPEEKARVLAAYTAHLQAESESAEASYRFRTLQDNWKWVVEYSMVTERDENGEPLHMIGVLIDFDRFKKDELTIATQNKLIDQVAFANSHKIRGPLARIKGLILLIDEMRKTEQNMESDEIKDILKKITISSEELDNALNQTAEILNRSEL